MFVMPMRYPPDPLPPQAHASTCKEIEEEAESVAWGRVRRVGGQAQTLNRVGGVGGSVAVEGLEGRQEACREARAAQTTLSAAASLSEPVRLGKHKLA